MLVNETGGVTDRYSFDAYGMMLGGDPNVVNPASTDLTYSGEQWDAGLQLQYLRARYYDQGVGRFNRVDPFGGSNQDPQSLHKYAYAHGNPAMGVDPSGKAWTLSEILVVVGGSFVVLGILLAALNPAGSKARDVGIALFDTGLILIAGGAPGLGLVTGIADPFAEGLIMAGAILGITLGVANFAYEMVTIILSPTADQLSKRNAAKLLLQNVMQASSAQGETFFSRGELYFSIAESGTARESISETYIVAPKDAFSRSKVCVA